MNRTCVWLWFLAWALLSNTAVADFLGIQNFDFEDPELVDFGDITSRIPIPGWDLYDPDGLLANSEDADYGVWKLGFFDGNPPDGRQVGFVFLSQPVGSGIAGLEQTLASVLEADTFYELSVFVGDPGTFSDPDFLGFPGYRIELWAGADRIGVDDNETVMNGGFRIIRIPFAPSDIDPRIGQTLKIRLINLLNGPGIEVDFDAVTLEAVPVQIETYRFSVGDSDGSMSGTFSYIVNGDNGQIVGEDASLEVTEATGDLAGFLGASFAGSAVSSSGTFINLAGGPKFDGFASLFFSASAPFSAPLPVNALIPDHANVFLGGVQLVGLFNGPTPAVTLERIEEEACSGPDLDGDGVPDACDNCVATFNPALGTMGQPAREAFQSTTGGQLDDDADGFGNQCDSKFGNPGQFVGGTDVADHLASFNKDRSGSNCGTLGTKGCAQFDLDNAGQFIGGGDFLRTFQNFNAVPGPTCDDCPLECEGPACP